MIVKQRKFKLSSGTLYGFAGGIFGIVTVGLMINAHLAPDTYPGCSERYMQAGMFGLKKSSGAVLRPVELQSRLAGREWGVLDNIEMKTETGSPLETTMTVKFNAGGDVNYKTRKAASGVGFNWQPGYLRKANSACLSYSVWVPVDFKFSGGGVLPGLFGASAQARANNKSEFSTRMRWLEQGRASVQLVLATSPEHHMLGLSNKWYKLPRGQWVNIEQEVVLNQPGQADGVLRAWIDGRLHLNQGGIAFRNSARTTFAGVTADTHYSQGDMSWAPAPKATKVKLSPMLLRWN